MNSFEIKLIATISMILAHIGLFFFPGNFYLYYVGRLAFPLFAWLIASGARHTKSLAKYAKRLLFFAIISQMPFILASQVDHPNYWRLNVLFTYFLSLVAINFLNKFPTLVHKAIILLSVWFASWFLRVDYGFLGVISVLIFYFFYDSKEKMLLIQTLLFVGYNVSVLTFYRFIKLLPIGLLSLFIITHYNGKQGTSAKYLFYLFYPVHYLVIYLTLLF